MLKPVMFVQDTVHLAVKLKSWLLNPNVVLKMGPTCEAETYHLQPYTCKIWQGRALFMGKRYVTGFAKRYFFHTFDIAAN